MDEKVKSLKEIWDKVHVCTVAYSTLLVCDDVLKNSKNLDEAIEKIDLAIQNVRSNNCHDFIEWLKRYLNIQV